MIRLKSERKQKNGFYYNRIEGRDSMEWKRIIYQRKFILFIISILIINFLLFVREQVGSGNFEDLLTQKKIRTEYVELCRNMGDVDSAASLIADKMKENEVFLSLLYYKELENDYPKDYEEFGSKDEAELSRTQPIISSRFDEKVNSLEENELLAGQHVLSDILKELEYLKSYEEYVDNIHEQASDMRNISIFSNKGSFAYRNILKTEHDFSKLKFVNVTLGNDRPITSVVNYGTNHYMLLLLVAALTLQLTKERQIGLWTLIHSTRRGRAYLFINRCVVLFLGTAIMTIGNYLGLFLVSRQIHGELDFGRSVQSVEQFHEITANISIGTFIILLIAIKIVLLFLLSLLIWFVHCSGDSKVLQLGFLGIVLGVEYVAYRWIPPLSNWNSVKYINLFHCINPTEIMISYRNLLIFNVLANLKVLFFFAFAVFLLLLIYGCYVTNVRKKPIHPVAKCIQYSRDLMNKLPMGKISLSLFWTELYKLMILQKGGLILLSLLWLLLSSFDTHELYYSSEEKLVNQFYEEMGGAPKEAVYTYIENLKSKLQSVELEYQEKANLYSLNQISSYEYEEASLKYMGYEGQRKALMIIQNRMQYIKELKDETGSQVWLVNPRGYEYLMGEDAFSKHAITAFEAVFCVILLISGIFSFEKSSGSIPLVRSTQKGRTALFRIKLKTAAVIVFLIWFFIYGFELWNAYHYYRLSYLDAPIQSLSIFRDITFSIRIGTVLAIVYLLRLLLLLATAAIAILLSLILKDNSIPASVAALLSTSFLYIIGLSGFSNTTIVLPIGFYEILLRGIKPANVIVICSLLIGGGSSIYQSHRIWCGHSKLRGKGSDSI